MDVKADNQAAGTSQENSKPAKSAFSGGNTKGAYPGWKNKAKIIADV